MLQKQKNFSRKEKSKFLFLKPWLRKKVFKKKYKRKKIDFIKFLVNIHIHIYITKNTKQYNNILTHVKQQIKTKTIFSISLELNKKQ